VLLLIFKNLPAAFNVFQFYYFLRTEMSFSICCCDIIVQKFRCRFQGVAIAFQEFRCSFECVAVILFFNNLNVVFNRLLRCCFSRCCCAVVFQDVVVLLIFKNWEVVFNVFLWCCFSRTYLSFSMRCFCCCFSKT
jgi:hypothetical protein